MYKLKYIKALPNIISLIRIIFSLMLISVEALSNTFFIIYIICGISDFLDGFIARKTGTATSFGAKLDSIADMVMIAVLIFVLYPVVNPSAEIIIFIAATCLVRLAAITVGLIKYKTFAGLHTYGNKITGAALVLFPFLILLIHSNIIIYLICFMGFISALEELIIQLFSKRLDLNVKCIFHI
ncbi:MAG: CDP-alcohol phosphatidyltransferase family protein [Solirubrobacterales bacterium]